MIDVVHVPAWQRLPWLRHGFSTRTGGTTTVYSGPDAVTSLNLGWTQEDDPTHVAANRRLLLQAVTGNTAAPLFTLRQVHGTVIHTVADSAQPPITPDGRARDGDGLVTNLPGSFLGIQTADCVPILLVDPVHRAVSGLHAGWRGTVAAMAEHGVAHMAAAFGSRPDDLLAAIGPSIGPCCYTVGDEVHTAFAARFSDASELFRENDLDLWRANRRQLQTAGLRPESIHTVAECTGCALTSMGQRKYFSHRIDCGVTGRMMSVIGITALP